MVGVDVRKSFHFAVFEYARTFHSNHHHLLPTGNSFTPLHTSSTAILNSKMAEKKTCLITGCSSGIGHSLAMEFHRRGLRVFATARSADKLSELSAVGIETLSLEVDKPQSIEAVKQEVSRRTGGRLDVLVNNAGRNYTVPALEVDFDEVQQTFEVNVFAVMRICQAFAPLLIEAKGTIVQTGSLAAYT